MISSDPTSIEVFGDHFNRIKETIEFNPLWISSNGYYDYAVNLQKEGVDYVQLKPGQEVKCVTDDGHKIIFVGTPLGTLAVFDRFNRYKTPVVSFCGSQEFNELKIIIMTELSVWDLVRIFGVIPNDNIGTRLDRLFFNRK